MEYDGQQATYMRREDNSNEMPYIGLLLVGS